MTTKDFLKWSKKTAKQSCLQPTHPTMASVSKFRIGLINQIVSMSSFYRMDGMPIFAFLISHLSRRKYLAKPSFAGLLLAVNRGPRCRDSTAKQKQRRGQQCGG